MAAPTHDEDGPEMTERFAWKAPWDPTDPAPHVLFAQGRALLFYRGTEHGGERGLWMAEFAGCDGARAGEPDPGAGDGAFLVRGSQWKAALPDADAALLHFRLVLAGRRLEFLARSVRLERLEMELDEALAAADV